VSNSQLQRGKPDRAQIRHVSVSQSLLQQRKNLGLIHDYAAIGVKASVSEVSDKVSPLITDLLAVNATDHRKLPAVEASCRLMWLIVSVAVIA
jgi:hypothetical protein